MALSEPPRPPHKAGDGKRSKKKGGQRRDVLRTIHIKTEKRLSEKVAEATNGDNRENSRRNEAVHQRQQHDDSQKYESGCGEVEAELEARPRREHQADAARGPQRDQVTKPMDELSLHLCDLVAHPAEGICQPARFASGTGI